MFQNMFGNPNLRIIGFHLSNIVSISVLPQIKTFNGRHILLLVFTNETSWFHI